MIKNIIFDIDGVLVSLDKCYLNFLRATYAPYKDITYEEMVRLWPLSDDEGAFDLPGHLFADFMHSSHYSRRPLFQNTIPVLKELKKAGITLITLTVAAFPEKKRPWLVGTFGDLFDAYEFSPPMTPKDNRLEQLVAHYKLNKNETLFIDDRFSNIRAGIKAGLKVVRMQPELSLPLPADLKHVPSISDLQELLPLITAR